MPFIHRVTLILLLLLAPAVEGEDAVRLALKDKILPVLADRCLECHDADSAKGDLNLDALWEAGPEQMDLRVWWKIVDQLEARAMPPAPKEPLDAIQRDAILRWATEAGQAVLASKPTDPGVRKIRRLTRDEYNYTLRDLLGIKGLPGDKFPSEGSGGEGFDNNADTLFIPPLLLEKYFTAADEVVAEVFGNEDLKKRFLEAGTDRFLTRAFRRPPTKEESATYGKLKSERLLKMVLLSPEFLFRLESNRPKDKQPWKVGSYEMASRLSYFLWSSMPDDALFDLAAQNKLQDAKVIADQTRRLLKDPKATAFVRHFGARWLDFGGELAVDRRKYPAFSPELETAFNEEIFRFTDHILRGNGKALDFLDSKYTFLNQKLAEHYGIGNVKGPEFRQVALTDPRRGGLTGMGAILAHTSYPQRTSPVLRGKWVLEQLLGTPPPPPPPNIPSLPNDDRDLKEKTLRQRLEAHRSKPACMGCHARLDPPGFGLENFDPIGQWREVENGKPIDAGGQFWAGESFRGPAELRKQLMASREKFRRNLCTRLLGYALERGLEVPDQPTLLRLVQTLEQQDDRMESLIVAVTTSFPFTHRRNP